MYELNAFGSRMVKYLFDKVSNRTKMKVCKASDTTRVYLEQTYPSYDAANRLLKSAVTPDTFTFKYWDTGPLKQIRYPNKIKEQYWLTNRNFIDSMVTYDSTASRILHMFVYHYNPLADRDTMVVKITRPSGLDTVTGYLDYTYDGLRRLTSYQPALSIKSEDTPFSFSYDPVGNRLTKVELGTTTYRYDKRNNHLDSSLVTNNNHEYAYDKNGNIYYIDSLLENYRRYRFDYENRLIRARTWQIEGGDSVVNDYCALGKRIRRIFYDASASAYDTTRYCYDDMYTVCEFGNLDSLLSKYVYANGLLLARYDSSKARYYYHHDGLSSTIGMTDTLRTIVKSYVYDPFGDIWDSAGAVKNNYLYTGQEFDRSPLWFYNLRARFYDPKIGRFVSEDPILSPYYSFESTCGSCRMSGKDNAALFDADPQYRNAYPYIANNPINFTDEYGLSARECIDALGYAKTLWAAVREGFLYDKFAHCFAFCEINKACGQCIWWLGSEGVEFFEGYRDAADIDANKLGRNCPPEIDCLQWCSRYFKMWGWRQLRPFIRG